MGQVSERHVARGSAPVQRIAVVVSTNEIGECYALRGARFGWDLPPRTASSKASAALLR
jgi:hypothetical protein